jgi:hypothetical protein
VTLRRVALVKYLGFNLLSVLSFLMRVLKFVSKRALRVFWILEVIFCARLSLRVRFSEPIFLSVSALFVVWLLVFRRRFGNGIGY